MSTARWCLKSPRSLCGTSTYSTMVTQKSRSLSRIINSDPLRSMSIGPPIPEMRLFQTLTLKLQGQGHGCGQMARSDRRPRIKLLPSFVVIGWLVATKFCSDWMTGSHFVMQTSKFLVINVTAVNLGQGQGRSASTFSQMHTFFVPNI